MPEKISIVVAVARNQVIGKDNSLPWKLRNDLQRFKRLTMGHYMLMGRRTFQSIPNPLPGRHTIVLTHQGDFSSPHRDVSVIHDLDTAIALVPSLKHLYIVGGATIYDLCMPIVNEILMTRVLVDIEGDTKIEPFDLAGWQQIASEYVPSDHRNQYPSVFEHWVKTR